MCQRMRKKPRLSFISSFNKEDKMMMMMALPTVVVDHLPEELISEILQKLPAKFLIQMKPVCKLWSNQVTNRHFACSHLVGYHQQHSDEQVIIIERICLQPYKHDYNVIKLVQEIEDMKAEKQFKIYSKIRDFFMKDQGDDILLKASCDGLILLQSKNDLNQFYVCNPITRHCTKLPRLETSRYIFYLALVLDEQSMYKVVAICQDSLKCFVLKEGKTTEWKEFDTGYKNSVILSSQSLTLVNQEYHWLRFQDNGMVRFEPYLYSMNAGTEEIRFRETKVSSEITCRSDHNSILEMKGSLCLTDSVSDNFNQIDIWTLHDKDKYNCQWTKTYSIVIDHSEFKTSPHVYSFPRTYQRQTVILIQYKNLLLFYDLEKKESRNFDFPIEDFSQIDIPGKNKLFTSCQFVHLNSLINWE